MTFTQPIPFEEALDKLGRRSPIGSTLTSEQWGMVPLALRERAMFSSQVENVRFLQRTKDSLTDFLSASREELTLPDGSKTTALKTGSRAQFVEQMREFAIAEGMGDLVPADKRGTIQDITSERRLQIIFDTQVKSATSYGDWLQGMDPDVLDEFPAWRFIRVQDVHEERVSHRPYEDEVALKTALVVWKRINEDFGVPWGPWGWGCGHDVEDVSRDEAEDLGLVKPGETVKPVVQDFNESLKASVRTLDPDLQQVLTESFGDQVKFEDGAVWWKGDRAGKRWAVDPKPKPPKPPKRKPGEWPSDLTELENVRPLGGSTGAQLVRDPVTGDQYVLKRGASPEHLREEFLADEIYRSAGVAVPEARLYESDGKPPTKLAKFIEGKTLKQWLSTAGPEERKAMFGAIQKDFAVDAWLGNWDVAGLGMDNILVDSAGKPWRIDNGGSLRFRAMGTPKTASEWNEFPVELWTLRDIAKNPVTAEIFGDLPFYDLPTQVARLDPGRLPAGVPPELRRTLEARLEQLQSVAKKASEFEATRFLPGHADQVTRHMVGMRADGVFAEMAGALKQAHAGDVRPKDAAGRYFNHLRATKADAVADPSQSFYDDLLMAAKTINGHHVAGNTQYNAPKLAKALGHKPALQKLLASGKPAEKQMAAYYLSVVENIEKAQGSIANKVDTVTKFDLPAAKGLASDSVVARAAVYMRKVGADWSIVTEWANAQAGSSKSPESRALKYWWMRRLRDVTPSDFHDAPEEALFKVVQGRHGTKYDATFEAFHALVQEVLARTEFEGNDRTQSLLRVLRTESTSSAVPFAKGRRGIYKRGVNESGSIFAPVFSGTRTVTAVPHTRITGTYFLERTPGTGHTFFLGDSENEVTYIGFDLPTLNLGKGTAAVVNLSPGLDSSKWEIK